MREIKRIRQFVNNAIQSVQLIDDRQNHIHGYRSLGFYQCAQEVQTQSSSLVVGDGYGNGVQAS